MLKPLSKKFNKLKSEIKEKIISFENNNNCQIVILKKGKKFKGLWFICVINIADL